VNINGVEEQQSLSLRSGEGNVDDFLIFGECWQARLKLG
jgi:hypothetical protein